MKLYKLHPHIIDTPIFFSIMYSYAFTNDASQFMDG